MIWLPSSASSSERTFTCTPVCASNALTSRAVVCSCWPLYSVIDWPASDPGVEALPLEALVASVEEPPEPPHAASVSTAARATTTAAAIESVMWRMYRFPLRISPGAVCRRYPIQQIGIASIGRLAHELGCPNSGRGLARSTMLKRALAELQGQPRGVHRSRESEFGRRHEQPGHDPARRLWHHPAGDTAGER